MKIMMDKPRIVCFDDKLIDESALEVPSHRQQFDIAKQPTMILPVVCVLAAIMWLVFGR